MAVQVTKSFWGALIVVTTHQNPSVMSTELLEASIPPQAFLTSMEHMGVNTAPQVHGMNTPQAILCQYL